MLQSETRRPRRIGVLNLMPEPELYEAPLTDALGGSGFAVELAWMRLAGRSYSRSNLAYIDSNYHPYHGVVSQAPLDGLIITGAALDHLPFGEITLMPELSEIVADASKRGTPVLGLCWGAMALGYLLLGIDRQEYPRKLFGVFECETLNPRHAFSDGLDDRFWSAQSRYAGFCVEGVRAAVEAGRVVALARSEKAGDVILATADCKLLLNLGHPEYSSTRLVEEYARDCVRGVANVLPPQNVDLRRPSNLWRSHGRVFFGNWLRALSG